MLTSSSTLTLDFINQLAHKENSERKNILTMRVFIAIFIAISAVIAIVQAKSRVTFIAQLMGISWGALAGAFLAPFLYGLYWKKTTKAAVAVGYVFGCGMMIIQLLISLGLITVHGAVLSFVFTNSLYSGVFAMLLSLIIVPVVSLFTQSTKPAHIEEKFSCYDRTVQVHAKTVLSDRKDTPQGKR